MNAIFLHGGDFKDIAKDIGKALLELPLLPVKKILEKIKKRKDKK